MAFTAAFTASQDISGSPLTIVDTSDYTDEGKGTFSARNLYLYLADGRTMIADGTITDEPTAINFSFASYPSDEIEIPIDKDWGFSIVLELTSTSPQPGSTYVATSVVGLTLFSKSFAQTLQQGTQAQIKLMNDNGYKFNLFSLYMEIDNVENSTSYSSLSSVQNAIDRIYYNYITNQSNAF